MKQSSGIVFSLITCLLFTQTMAQNLNPQNVTNIIPPSPEVSAMAKYIDMPVSYSTGIPDISIPLYKMTAGDLSIPVSLSYHAGGIKVEECATWVGLGWNLDAGGSVSRVVRGLPDDFGSNGYMYTSVTVDSISRISIDDSAKILTAIEPILDNALDVEPDIFIFSAMGYSGRFYFDQASHTFIMAPFQNIKIDYTLDAGNLIKGWIFTLPNGIKCYFGQDENATRQEYAYNGIMTTILVVDGSPHAPSSSPAPVHITSWQLAQVKSPTGRTMNLFYSALSQEDYGRSGETTDYKGITGCDQADGKMRSSFYHHAYTNPILSKITSEVGEVNFEISSTSRLDMLGDSRSLNSIIVKNKLNKTIKRFDLTYGYFISTVASGVPGANDTVASKRLYLQSLLETDSTQSLNKPYVFTYDTTIKLPSRLSASQDFWGFYNGKNNGITLTPAITTVAVYGSGQGYIAGADRTVDLTYAQACILHKIEYPTGGTTEYLYESNQANPGHANAYAGGFKITGLQTANFNITNDPFREISANHYADTFTISNPIFPVQENVRVIANCDGCTDIFTIDCPMSATIDGISDPSFHLTITRNISNYEYLPEGTYAINVVITPNVSYPSPTFNIDLQWSENPDPYNLIVGGLRVKKIIGSILGGMVLGRRYDYHYHETNTRVNSGEMYNMPVQLFKIDCGNNLPVGLGGVTKVVSNSALPLFSDDGQMIRYTDVTEYYDTSLTTFKTEYTFSINPPYLAVPASDHFPFGSPVQSDWRSGLLLEKKQYEKQSSTYRLLFDEQYYYGGYAGISTTNAGFRVAPLPYGGTDGIPQSYAFSYYSFQSEWYLQDSSRAIQYAYDASTPIAQETLTKKFYNAHYTLFKTQVRNSRNQVMEAKTWYPYDFNNVSGYNISSLLANGITEIPIRQERTLDSKLVSGIAYKYNAYGQPVSVYQYENRNLVDTSAKDPDVITPSLFNLKTSISYDGNSPVEVNATTILNSYIWDNTGSHPIAQIVNAPYATTSFTSFETDGTGNWDFASGGIRNDLGSVTGTAAYTLSTANVERTGLDASKIFLITYWLKNSSGTASVNDTSGIVLLQKNGWTLYQRMIRGTASVTVTGSGVIDELRLYPENAQMISYTYEPMIGLTSQCDANNRVAYYEYDGTGRLLRVRDHDRNIIKSFTYTYQETQ
jgi:hypothetical protein